MRSRQEQLGCAEVQIPANCNDNECFHKRFRSIDGTCNNLDNPIVGAAFSPFIRLLPSAYDDGINSLAGAQRRPNPREVSMFLLSTRHAISSPVNSLVMQFGQITRSFPVCGTGTGNRPREQYNENTAFIDGSSVYSSEAVTLRSLREGAMLKTHVVNGRTFPPNNRRDSMTAGDDRATIFLGLAAMHTTFLRLHNNIAATLQNMNRHWNQDRIFQETRKIVGSVIQVITYQEFLPALIGPFHARLVPPYVKYNPSVNPGVLNEFAAAAYRLHGMIQEFYPLLGPNFESKGRVPFLDGVGRIEQVLSAIDAVYRGFIATAARSPQRITSSVTEHLFGGSDMATINIQRGRDHGFRPYNEYRKLCQLKPVTNFNEWPEVTEKAVRERVAQLYRSPDEEPIEGSLVGPTFACIIAEQFVRLRDGDRFYYETEGLFTSNQLVALKAVTLSWVLCETSDGMTRIVPNAFTIDRGQRAVHCSSLQRLDLTAWKE
ncbi:Peroxidase mlt-7 [Trichostrongylus colubriformis]|uniref:Peroxidase mlt-7 n=1 Tax=Trichostrongylus colubriformis TaxID=6319 RepID=A0AAN8G2V3_TRICO